MHLLSLIDIGSYGFKPQRIWYFVFYQEIAKYLYYSWKSAGSNL